MDLYDTTANDIARVMTLRYSTSFGWATRLMSQRYRANIFTIYGLVRIADEIVDSYRGADARALLDALEKETYTAIRRGYSVNPLVHAFQKTARSCGIGAELIAPFFASMRVDCDPPKSMTPALYQTYIYGSAEVVGLMCLKVFVDGDEQRYATLQHGAQRLGAAYQKVNFLRDFAVDKAQLGRVYLPFVKRGELTESAKATMLRDIDADFATAEPYIRALPWGCRRAVGVSFVYYRTLANKLRTQTAGVISRQRIRLPNAQKLFLTVVALCKYAVPRAAKLQP